MEEVNRKAKSKEEEVGGAVRFVMRPKLPAGGAALVRRLPALLADSAIYISSFKEANWVF